MALQRFRINKRALRYADINYDIIVRVIAGLVQIVSLCGKAIILWDFTSFSPVKVRRFHFSMVYLKYFVRHCSTHSKTLS